MSDQYLLFLLQTGKLSQSARDKITSKQTGQDSVAEERELARQRHLKAQEEKRKQREKKLKEINAQQLPEKDHGECKLYIFY